MTNEPRPPGRWFVIVESGPSSSPHVSACLTDRVGAHVKQAVTRMGFETVWPEPLPSSDQLGATRDRGYVVAPTIDRLDVITEGARTRIECTVSIRVARWLGTDRGEYWEPGSMAIASAAAYAVTASVRRRIGGAIRDCLDDAVAAVAERRIEPFLRRQRIASRGEPR